MSRETALWWNRIAEEAANGLNPAPLDGIKRSQELKLKSNWSNLEMASQQLGGGKKACWPEPKAAPPDPPMNNYSTARLVGATSLFVACILLQSGCHVGDTPENRAVFANLSINAKPVQLILDSGANASVLTTTAAERLGVTTKTLPKSQAGRLKTTAELASQGLSEPVQLTMGTETVTVQLPVNSQISWLMRGFIGENRKIDGVIAWSEIADNILVFDGAQHTIHRVETLPEETASWIKMKVHPAHQLLLEAPQPDGTTGFIFVNTASPLGVTLPPTEWKAWRVKYPDMAHIYITHLPPSYLVGFGDIWDEDDRMAEEIALGPITLTAVPAHLAFPAEMAQLEHYAGTLGLAALERMDMVVDGKGGFAYLRPKAAPVGADGRAVSGVWPPPQRDWRIEGNLHFRGDHLLAAAGAIKSESGDFDAAMADFSQAIAQDPNNAENYRQRGVAKDKKGDDAGAIADFDQALTLAPDNVQILLNRSDAKKNNGDLPGALADSSRAIELAPDNPATYAHRSWAREITGDAHGVIADLNQVIELETRKGNHPVDYNRLINAYLARAGAEQTIDDQAAAIADFTRAIDFVSDNPLIFNARAEARYANGDLDGAIADFNRALKMDTKYVEAYVGRAQCKARKGDYPGALGDFDRGLELDPENPACLQRGVARASHADYAGALADLDKFIALTPDNAALAQVYRQIVVRRLGRAPEDFAQIVAKFSNGWAKSLGGYLTGGLDEAALQAAAAQRGRVAVPDRECAAFYFIGMMHFFNGDTAGARENWQSAIATKRITAEEYLLAEGEIARLDAARRK